MVRMIPHVFSQEIKSTAEKKIFEMFRTSETEETVIIIHSLGVAEHCNNIFGEIDFVIICSEGILCVEVKGGIVERNGGLWYFTNRFGKREAKHKGPFEQAQGNMHSLRNYLQKRLGNQNPIVRSQFASCVIMPNCVFTYESIDIVPNILFDQSFQWSLSDIIRQGFTYWRKLCHTKYGFEGGRLTAQEVQQVADILRGDFRFVPSLKTIVNKTMQELCALTDEQYEILESLEDNERTLVSGMAGTGKTILAAEQCRRAFWAGKKVLYVCFNYNIAQYIKNRFAQESVNVDVSTLHALMMKTSGVQWSPDNSREFYLQELPELFLSSGNIAVKYDLVIVDEGQDLLNNIYLKCLDSLFEGGLKVGCWSIFFDPNQNLFNPQSEFEILLPELRKYAANYRLSVNCRNTKQIANANTLATNIPQVNRVKASGPDVEFIKYSTLENELSLVQENLLKVKSEGINSGDIILLSVYTFDNYCCCLSRGRLSPSVGTLKTDSFLWRAKKNELRFSTISAFKGLESKVVFLLDVDAFSDNQRRLLNYVAISRACASLYVFYDASAEEERQQMLLDGYKNLIP